MVFMVCFFYMTVVNTREAILKHETPEYIQSRPKWVLGQGRIPDLSDYRKLSVDSMEEAMTLAKIGQIIGQQFIPTIQDKPFKTYFTQALILGASLITRSMAEKYHLDFEKYRSVLLVCPSRYGKQIGHSVKIMTTKGWKKHGELQIGDYVFHPSGKPIKVVGKKEWTPDHYLVHFQNGQSIECHANHEWRVYNKRKSNGRGNPQGGYEVLETHEMVDKVLYKGGKGYRSRYLIDPASPCQFDKKEQPLDPYFFGCWLGDGTSKKPILTLSPEKAEHILPNIPFSVTSSYKLEGCSSYEFSHQNILTHLYSLEVFGDKHIPDCYKYGSPEQQKALLAGIIDTDGYVDRNGRVIISCANEKLAKDLLELLTLMGECPYETVVPATISSSGVVGKHDIHQIGYQPAYDLPTKFKYLTRLTPHRRIGITKIEKPKHSEPGNCIQVDSPDGLYLVGEKLIPTHNSFINGASILIHAGANGEEVQIGAATMPKAEIIQAKAVEMLPWTVEKLQEGLIVDGQEEDRFKKIKRLSTKVSKDSLRWTNGGSIGMFSTNETKKNADVAAAGAIGIGGDFAVFDEVQLMTPVGFRTASRFMVENPNTKRFCVGNPMINGHFKELYDNPNTFVVHINEVTCIIEERMTRRGIELTDMPTYSPEYRAFVETEFPDERSGTRFFTTLPEIWDPAKLPTPVRKFYFLGIDSAYKGGDSLMVSILSFNEGGGQKWFALEKQIDLKQRFAGNWGANTTLDITLDILKLWEQYNVVAGCIDIGFGIHIYEKLRDLDPELPLEPINYASKPTEWRLEQDYNAKFAMNKRAELHLDLRDLASNDLIFIAPDCYEEVRREMGEVSQSPAKQKIQIEPKKDIKARLGRSPDAMDSMCLAIHAAVLSGVMNGTNGLQDTDIMEIL